MKIGTLMKILCSRCCATSKNQASIPRLGNIPILLPDNSFFENIAIPFGSIIAFLHNHQ